MRGRPRKPTPAKILQGTFRKDRENPDEPKPDLVKNLNAPTWLDQYGRECWDHYVPKLIKTGILTSIDVFLLPRFASGGLHFAALLMSCRKD